MLSRCADPVPPELGDLANLTSLYLDGNRLSGPIPSELGDLANLTSLYLDGNRLSGPIPPEFGDLANLTNLYLDDNRLDGPIPPELGDLARLESLYLTTNDLEGPVPSEFGGMASLRDLGLSRNRRMSGALPRSLTALSGLETFVTEATGLCAPSDEDFLNWLNRIPVQRVARCGRARTMAYLTQAVQSPEFPVPLVAGEEALLRVFVTAGRSNDQDLPLVRATFYANGAQTHVVNVPGKPGPIPTDVAEGTLETSANARIPGDLVRPGLELVIDVDPEGTLDPALQVTKRIPETGRLAVDVRSMPPFDLTLIPFLWTESSDSSILDITKGLTAESDLFFEMRTLLPVADFDVTVHAPVLTSSTNGFALLSETRAIRALEGGSGHYMGTMASALATGPSGVASLRGRTSFSKPIGWVMAHELGHNMSLLHPWENPLFPSYPEGRIGVWGYDARGGGRLVQPDGYDIMLGCCWISDFHVTQALRFRQNEAADARAARFKGLNRAESLLLWGGVDVDGVPYLNPTFVADAPPALPDSAGDYTVSGRDASGRELFSLSFTMPVALSEEAEVSSFVFALPAQPGWADALASVTLSGPAGTATLDGDSKIPMAILRSPRTGQVRGILREPSLVAEVAADAVREGAPGLEVLFSRGIPGVAAWSR